MDQLYAYVRSLFAPNLTKISSTFTKTIADLDNLIVSRQGAIRRNADEIVRIMERNTTMHAETQQAAKFANKLRELVG